MADWTEIGPCRLACGDCLEILPEIEGIDCIIADPPYGLNWSGPRMKKERVIGDDVPFDPATLLRFDVPTILWGANNYASRLPDSQNWIVWLKRAVDKGCRTKDHGDCELAWTRDCFNGGVKVKRFIWDGNIREKDVEMRRLHPAQKPVAVMEYCVELTPGDIVLDCYMGSGSTGVACVRLGRAFVGVEISPEYFDIACRRIENEVKNRQGRLFD